MATAQRATKSTMGDDVNDDGEEATYDDIDDDCNGATGDEVDNDCDGATGDEVDNEGDGATSNGSGRQQIDSNIKCR